jgi:hypothetical protein
MKRIATALLICTALLVACGGGSGGSGSSNPPIGLGNPSSKLFIADAGNSAISSTITVTPQPGMLSFDRSIAGAATAISNHVRGMAVDTVNNRLYVANGNAVLVFNNIATANGNVSPARTITSTRFVNVTSLYLDTTNNVLYVGDESTGIWMFNNANTANGQLVPTRTLTGDFGGTSFLIQDIFVDVTRNILYVSRSTSVPSATEEILVFANASTVNGSAVAPSRSITPSPTMSVGKIFVDVANDSLYMANASFGAVRVFTSASLANGIVSPARTINWGSAASDIAVDVVANRLYALNAGNVFIIANAGTANGSVSATTLTAPGGSSFTAIAIKP